MLSLSPKRHANLGEFYNPITATVCIKDPAYLPNIHLRLDWMTLRVTTVIMTNEKSDKMKQSIDNLEKYRLFTEDKLKLFIHKKIDQCGSLLRKIMLEGEMYHLFAQFH